MIRRAVISSLALAALLIFDGCGNVDQTPVQGNAEDAAFAGEMIDHHRGAVEMAQSAKQDARHQEVKDLAEEIIRTQDAEIDRLTSISSLLASEGVKPPENGMGMSRESLSIEHEIGKFAAAKDADKEFIDSMIPHHTGAIAMSKELLKHGENPELRKMAEAIILAQTAEIKQMQRWRKQWYGSELKAPPDGSYKFHQHMREGAEEMRHEGAGHD